MVGRKAKLKLLRIHLSELEVTAKNRTLVIRKKWQSQNQGINEIFMSIEIILKSEGEWEIKL